jgi:hypothetical protein
MINDPKLDALRIAFEEFYDAVKDAPASKTEIVDLIVEGAAKMLRGPTIALRSWADDEAERDDIITGVVTGEQPEEREVIETVVVRDDERLHNLPDPTDVPTSQPPEERTEGEGVPDWDGP